MVRHSVFFWLQTALSDGDLEDFEKGLRGLFEIDVVSRGQLGKAAPTPERPVTQNSYDYALFLDFEDVGRHNQYQEHPGHLSFVEQFSKWFAEVRVYDTEMNP